MAKSKRNQKTHPRVRGENDPDDQFMPPDRPDVQSRSETAAEGAAEVIDLRAPETVDTTGDGKGDDDGRPPSSVERRGEAADPAPPRRQERDDRAVARQRTRGRDNGEQNDDRAYSRKVQKRIQRERALVNRERALREAAQRELGEERTARQELAERVLKIERDGKVVAANTDVKALEAQIEALVPQIAAATEAGETAKALTLQIKLGDLQGDLKVLKFELKLRGENARIVEENERKERERQANAARTRGAGAEDAGGLTPDQRARADRFVRANRRWWNDEVDAKEAALDHDKDILAEIADGELDFEPYSDEHLEELAARVHEDYPDVEIRDLDREPYEFDDDADGDDQGDDDRGRNGRGARVQNQRQRLNGRSPTRGAGNTGRHPLSDVEMARQGKVVLTEEDFKEMRIFKLDPNNAEHKKRFAQERARTILAADARERGAR